MLDVAESPKPQRILPQGYHLAHFREMLGFVRDVYPHALTDDARAWLADFDALPRAAQSLYVRMANRKGTVFRVDRFAYADVPDVGGALARLGAAGFVGPLRADDFAAALAVQSKDSLVEMLTDEEEMRPGWPRARLLALAEQRLGFAETFGGAQAAHYAVQRRGGALRFLQFLYFGRIEESLTRFALRDLGLMRTREAERFEPRFETRADAEASFFYADLLSNIGETQPADLDTAPPVTEAAQDLHDQCVFALGRRAELTGDIAAARDLYDRGRSAECRERAVRTAWAEGDRAGAAARLDAILADPVSDGEALFAEDFHARKFGGKRTSAITDLLRAAKTLDLDESWRGAPEQGAAGAFARAGWAVDHAENAPWRALFGLLFWDQLYGAEAGLASGFDRLPPCLKAGTFYDRHRDAVEARLALLRDPSRATVALLRTFASAHGTPNGVFRWRGNLIERAAPLLNLAPPDGLAGMLRAMAQDYANRKDGFPDLMLTRDGALRLVEIKAEGDVIRRNQLAQLDLLRRSGFDVGVHRVAWRIDPDQPYVVVDVETTGGKPPHHRVTEIGAVKVIGGEIVARWSSLINPDRAIPANITRITGISDAMVADAPRFAEIAEDFHAFTEGAVFAAHNVRFDHGFISAEFERVGLRFRRPQICTCQSMRAARKGLRSYSLANLCAHFEIPLESHHRALCDAEAAAHLLLIIQGWRNGDDGNDGPPAHRTPRR